MVNANEYVNNLINVQKFEENKALQGVLTVAGVTSEEIQNEKKLVVCFDMLEEKLALNNTNTKALVKVLGNETDGWWGAKIQLEIKPTLYGNEQVKSLRIKSVVPVK